MTLRTFCQRITEQCTRLILLRAMHTIRKIGPTCKCFNERGGVGTGYQTLITRHQILTLLYLYT